MKSCVVLGAGRSGTSMVAGTLVGSGLHTRDDLLDVSEANPKGFFESKTVMRLNEDLLAQVVPVRPGRLGRVLFRGRLYRGQLWLATPPIDSEIAMTPRIAEEILDALPAEPYCLKDPRFSYTLHLWLPLLNDPLCICVFRRPEITVESLLREVGQAHYLRHVTVDEERAYRIWMACYEQILDLRSHCGTWLFVHYDQWLDPDEHPRLEAAINGKLAWAFATRELARSQPTGTAPGPATAVYEELCALAEYSD